MAQASDHRVTVTGSENSNQWTINYKNPNGPTGIATPLSVFTLQFNQPGNFGPLANGNSTTYAPVESFYQVQITRATQTFSNVPNITTKSLSDSPISVTVPTASSGLPVTLVSGGANTSVTATATPGVYSVRLISTGTGNIQYRQVGNDSYFPGGSGILFTIMQEKLSQTIAPIPTIASQTAGGQDIRVTVPAATSRLPVTLSIKSGPATISGNTIKTTGKGTVVVAANQAGSSTHNAAPEVTTSFNVLGKSQTISAFAAIPARTLNQGAFAVTAPTSSSNLGVALTIKSGPATISGNIVTPTAAGTIMIAANQAGNAEFNAAAEVTVIVAINAAKTSQTIAAFATISQRTYSDGLKVSVTTPAATSGLAVALSIKSGPASISGSTITLTGAGTVVVAANQAGNASYSPASEVTTSFVVAKGSQVISKTVFPAAGIRINSQIDLSRYFSNSSGLPITYTITATPGSYTLVGSTLTVKSTSTNYLVQASQPGNLNFNAAVPSSQSLTAVTSFTYNVPLSLTISKSASPRTVDLRTGVSVWPNGSAPNFGTSWSYAGSTLVYNQPTPISNTGRSVCFLIQALSAGRYACLQSNGTLNYHNPSQNPFASASALSTQLGNLRKISAVDQSNKDVYNFTATINFL
jgi:hypothetical protein